MFAIKSVFLFAVFCLLSVVLAAIPPPSCLLESINEQPKPGDLKTICGEKSEDVQQDMIDRCASSDIEEAFKRFAESCKESGVEVELMDIPTPTGSDTDSPTSTTGDSDSQTEPTASGTGTPGAAPVNSAGSFVVVAAALAGLASLF